MADVWLIPCNAVRSQPPLLSNWLEKASKLIGELMHMSAKHFFSSQTSGHCVLVAQEGWGSIRRRAPAGLAAASLHPSAKPFGQGWRKPPSLGSQALGLGWCASRLCARASVQSRSLDKTTVAVKGGSVVGPIEVPKHLQQSEVPKSSFFSHHRALHWAACPPHAAAGLLKQPVSAFSSWPLCCHNFGSSAFNWHMQVPP